MDDDGEFTQKIGKQILDHCDTPNSAMAIASCTHVLMFAGYLATMNNAYNETELEKLIDKTHNELKKQVKKVYYATAKEIKE